MKNRKYLALLFLCIAMPSLLFLIILIISLLFSILFYFKTNQFVINTEDIYSLQNSSFGYYNWYRSLVFRMPSFRN